MRSTVRRLLVSGAVLALTAAGGGVLAVPAVARPADAEIRAAHFSPTTPGVDVYLSRFAGHSAPTTLWLSKVHYGSVSAYQPLTPGLYTVAMRPAGAAPSSPPVLSWTLRAKAGAAYTVAGVGAARSVRGVVIKDDLSAPPSGHGRVRVIQAASRAPVATISATGGHVISRDARFATVSDYATLPAGRWTVQARASAAPSENTRGPVTVKAGQVTSILLLDAKSSGITLRTVLDSAASGVRPAAAVPAGGGGTATEIVGPSDGTLWPRVVGVLAFVLLIAAASQVRTVARRRSRRATPADR